MRKTSVTDRQTDRVTECKPIVPPGFTGGGLIIMTRINVGLELYYVKLLLLLEDYRSCVCLFYSLVQIFPVALNFD